MIRAPVPDSRRPGAVLVLTLLLLVILDCVLVGTLAMARQQRRIAESRAHQLRLQLIAEGAIRRSLSEWPAQMPAPGAAGAVQVTAGVAGIEVRRVFELLDPDLVLVTATAAAPALPARYSAALLAHPPALAPAADLADAALIAEGATLADGSIVSSGPATICDSIPAPALRTVSAPLLEPGARLEGAGATVQGQVLEYFDAIARAALRPESSIRSAAGDTLITGPFGGILIAHGAVTLGARAAFRGLLLARGDLTVATGATLAGSARAGGHAHVRGQVTRDACEVESAIRSAGLRQARPVRGRPWVPSF